METFFQLPENAVSSISEFVSTLFSSVSPLLFWILGILVGLWIFTEIVGIIWRSKEE